MVGYRVFDEKIKYILLILLRFRRTVSISPRQNCGSAPGSVILIITLFFKILVFIRLFYKTFFIRNFFLNFLFYKDFFIIIFLIQNFFKLDFFITIFYYYFFILDLFYDNFFTTNFFIQDFFHHGQLSITHPNLSNAAHYLTHMWPIT